VTAPAKIAMSATFPMNQLPYAMKSTTCPRANPGARNKRSPRCVTAPPSRRPQATAHAIERVRYAATDTPMAARPAMTAKTQVKSSPI
jgi:hypothetical protein